MNSNNKLKYYLLNILYVLLPAVSILFLCEYNDAAYQTDKDVAMAKAVLAFMIYVFLIKKVQLFNWASLAITIILIPIHYIHRAPFLLSQDLLTFFDWAIWSQWLVLMVLVDLVRTFKKRDIKKMYIPTLIVYFVLFLAVWIFRNGRNEYLALLFPFLIFALVPLEKEERENLISRLCESWMLAFVIIMLRSFITNPYTGGRYYGSFVNIGAFGIFIGGTYTATMARAYIAKTKAGVKNYQFILCMVMLAFVAVATWLTNTRTLLMGIAMNLLFLFIFLVPREEKKKRRIRLSLVGVTALAGSLAIVAMAYMCKGLRTKSLIKQANTLGGIPGKIAFVKAHLSALWDEDTVFGAGVFKIGSFANAIDKLSSGRLTLAKVFLDKSTFLGGRGEGIQVGDYYAFTAHNTYVHNIYIYGIIGGTIMTAWLIYALVMLIKRWERKRSIDLFFSICFITTTLGMMLGESITYYYGVMFFTFISLRCLFYKEDADDLIDEPEDDFYEAALEESKVSEESEYVYVLFEEE